MLYLPFPGRHLAVFFLPGHIAEGRTGVNLCKRQRAKLVLSDGACFEGRLIGGGELPVPAEVVFNTSMTGYQEILTDPSYAGQIVVMTYPQIGNYGVHEEDDEKTFCAASGLVVRELSSFFSPRPGRVSLEDFMIARGMPGLSDVDTRSLALHIRKKGSIPGVIGLATQPDEELTAIALAREAAAPADLVVGVAGRGERRYRGENGRVAVVDFGVKDSIVSAVRRLGAAVEVFPARKTERGGFDTDLVLDSDFDFVVLSNGPGDPADVPGAIESVKELLGRIPILGICLGHQITALAMGGKTYKLKFGHRGGNQPVMCHRTGRVLITSQNHGYAVDGDFTGARVTFSNLNDGTVEGFAVESLLVECVQFHPEASPGPHDAFYIIEEFSKRVRLRVGNAAPAPLVSVWEGARNAQTV